MEVLVKTYKKSILTMILLTIICLHTPIINTNADDIIHSSNLRVYQNSEVTTVADDLVESASAEDLIEDNSETAEYTEEQLQDIDYLARIIYAEAGNQSTEGQRAVGSVVYNRWKGTGYGTSDTIIGVISFPGQFNGYQTEYWYAEYSSEIYQIAEEVYNGQTNLPSSVMNFKTNNCNVSWNLQVYKVIGDHTFYYSY